MPDALIPAGTTTDPHEADRRYFYKVELWTADELHIDRLLFAGSSLDAALAIFADYAVRRPRAHLTVRQRSRVLRQSPAPAG